MTKRDCWAEWVLRMRAPADPELRERAATQFRTWRERILDRAELAEGETLLDVGCGDGLVAFGAIERGAGLVVFSDISQDLLDESRRLAEELDVVDRCRFVLVPADDLHEVPDASVDVVTTRSVLIYVDDKESAFREFHRVLRPGGRVSLFEPINRLNRFVNAWDTPEIQDLADRVQAGFRGLQPRETDPMLNFDDRDLVDLAEAAGFERIRLTLEVETSPPEPVPWDAFLDMPFNPRIPSPREMIERVLTPEERERYEAYMKPRIEGGIGSRRTASAYLLAVKASG
jgi:ubiquinone/menaquinone biosynthesis C-methylase UbiE